MKKRGLIIILTVMLTILCLTAAAQAETATVRGGRLMMRQWGAKEAPVIATFDTGTKVTVLNKNDPTWYLCKAPNGTTGYMNSQYLSVGGSTGSSAVRDGDTVYVTSSNGGNVNLRTGPGTNFVSYASYAVGTKAVVLSSGTNWSYISIKGTSGFMMTKYLTTKAPSAPATKITAYVVSKNGYGVQMRTGPGTGYRVQCAYPVGQKVTVLSWGNTWSYISVGNKTGYMMTKFLDKKEPAPVVPPAGTSMVYAANGLPVRLRTGPGTQYEIIASYKPGTRVEILREGAIWDQVKIGSTTGYMMKSYILSN